MIDENPGQEAVLRMVECLGSTKTKNVQASHTLSRRDASKTWQSFRDAKASAFWANRCHFSSMFGFGQHLERIWTI